MMKLRAYLSPVSLLVRVGKIFRMTGSAPIADHQKMNL